MRESWTDDRLDDLNGKVDAMHLEMRTEFKAIRGELKEEFGTVRTETKEEFQAVRGEMKAGFDKTDERFERMDERLLQIYQAMLAFCGVAMAALIGLIATQI